METAAGIIVALSIINFLLLLVVISLTTILRMNQMEQSKAIEKIIKGNKNATRKSDSKN